MKKVKIALEISEEANNILNILKEVSGRSKGHLLEAGIIQVAVPYTPGTPRLVEARRAYNKHIEEIVGKREPRKRKGA